MSEGDDRKDEGMERAVRHANAAWKLAAQAAIVAVARRKPYFSADDVMAEIGPNVHTHEKRALGGITRAAAIAGVMQKSSKPPVNCARANCHSAPITVWESLIYRGQE